MKFKSVVFLYSVVLGALHAQPKITPGYVVNSASNARYDYFPNPAIAQGSLFTIYGTGLGPAASPEVTYPLKTELGSVSVIIASGGETRNAIPIFVSPRQINVILPGDTPVGSASVAVTYGNQKSNAVSFQIAPRSFGIFTVDSSGGGAGVLTNAKYQLYSSTSPAYSGDIAIAWGTGIGSALGDNGSAPPSQIDMPTLPLNVYVGTQSARVLYRGRAAFTGEDQINFEVPAGVTGCYVPIAVRIGDVVSNFVTMPIANAGDACSDPAPPLPTVANPNRDASGNVTFIRNTTISGSASTTEFAFGFFGTPQINEFPFKSPLVGNPYSVPAGACLGGVTYPAVQDFFASVWDAGTVTISGPAGQHELPKLGLFDFSGIIGGYDGTTIMPLSLNPGAYVVSGSGGSSPLTTAVGPFTQSFVIPEALVWTNQEKIDVIDRSQDLEITWAGGDPEGTVQITSDPVLTFICNVPTQLHRFTIPSFVLQSMPPSPAPKADMLRISSRSSTLFSAEKLLRGVINTVATTEKYVTYR